MSVTHSRDAGTTKTMNGGQFVFDSVRRLSIHHGRHTFISHALAGGRTLAEVRDAAGHANVTVTSGYLHVVVETGVVGSLFA